MQEIVPTTDGFLLVDCLVESQEFPSVPLSLDNRAVLVSQPQISAYDVPECAFRFCGPDGFPLDM